MTKTTTLSLEISTDRFKAIEQEAAKIGLQPASYLLLLDEIHRGQTSPAMWSAVKEIFTHDHAILRELAR